MIKKIYDSWFTNALFATGAVLMGLYGDFALIPSDICYGVFLGAAGSFLGEVIKKLTLKRDWTSKGMIIGAPIGAIAGMGVCLV